MALQVQQAEQDQHQAQKTGGGRAEAQRAEALQGLYGQTTKAGAAQYAGY